MSTLLLFDIDGTLIDSAGAGRDAIEGALVEVFGTAGPIDELSFAGLTDPWIARTLLTHAGLTADEIDVEFDALWTAYLSRLTPALADRRARLIVHPGIPELLDELASLDVTLALLTGNIAAGAREKLRACGLDGRFLFGAYGSDAEDRDLLPGVATRRAREVTGRAYDPARTWVIGDTPRDVSCARAGGVRAMAVATGQYSVAELEEAGADVVVETLADTGDIVRLLCVESRFAS